jgi:uncharacterized protein (DUF2141 family)
MIDVRLHAAVLAASLVLGSAAAGPAMPASPSVGLQVIIPNLKPDGQVVIAVYNDPGAWQAEGQAFRVAVTDVRDGMASASFTAPPGRYAVAVYQDKNGDGRLNLLPFRWPAEKVGFSGGERPLVGRPSWDKADFGLGAGERTTVFVRLR